MTLQWMFVAYFLYFEIFCGFLLSLSFISPSRWSKIFQSRLIVRINNYGTYYFNLFLAVLAFFWIDSIRALMKFRQRHDEIHSHIGNTVDLENQNNMRLFRSQRNFYISGFALFMWLILKRLSVLTMEVSKLEASNEASIRQAKSATMAAQAMLDKETKDKKSSASSSKKDDADSENSAKFVDTADLEKQLESKEKELKALKRDFEILKQQAENNNKEYDNLMAEHEKLQIKLRENDLSKKAD